jgi:hypothetical protein
MTKKTNIHLGTNKKNCYYPRVTPQLNTPKLALAVGFALK